MTTVEDGNGGGNIEHYSYTEGSSGAAVEYYKVIDGYHDTFSHISYEGQNSLQLIWEFFSRYDINGRR